MAKRGETEKKLNKIRLMLGIIISIFAISGSIYSITNYFAKAKEVELIQQRLDISIIDDQIFQKEQQIEGYKNLTIFERSGKELTDIEKMIIIEEEKELVELKDKKDRRMEQYSL